jgi:large subunit ribosomal protein L18
MLPKKLQDRQRRKNRIRARVKGTAARPRLSVYRSLTRISAQLIDDAAMKTIASASAKEAKKVGTEIAKKAKDAGVTSIVFDRNAYKYHGRVKALAEAAREGGLQF